MGILSFLDGPPPANLARLCGETSLSTPQSGGTHVFPHTAPAKPHINGLQI